MGEEFLPVPVGINRVICGNCLAEMQKMSENSIDLVFGSPPYEDARTYGIDFNLKASKESQVA